jgi:hypothetical protein
MRVCENFGRTSAPFLPQRVQVKLGSILLLLNFVGLIDGGTPR